MPPERPGRPEPFGQAPPKTKHTVASAASAQKRCQLPEEVERWKVGSGGNVRGSKIGVQRPKWNPGKWNCRPNSCTPAV